MPPPSPLSLSWCNLSFSFVNPPLTGTAQLWGEWSRLLVSRAQQVTHTDTGQHHMVHVTQFMPIRYTWGWVLRAYGGKRNETKQNSSLLLSERPKSNDVLKRSLDLGEEANFFQMLSASTLQWSLEDPHPSWCQGRKGKRGKDTDPWDCTWAGVKPATTVLTKGGLAVT